MGALFCPLAAEVGSLADWVNVAAATTVGIAVWRVSKKTNALADAANRTSASVAQLELQREAEAAQQRRDEQRLILVTMANPISMALVAMRSTHQLFGQDGFLERFQDSQQVRDFVSNHLRYGIFTIPESVRVRMHFVEIRIAAQILRAEGAATIFLKAIEGVGSTTGDLRTLSATNLSVAISREVAELEEAWEACMAACREAGLKVGPAPDSAPGMESASAGRTAPPL
jgi:hypothetical protein